ncbi:MAG: ATP-binding protein [Candidatus Bathyarchaeota archaeon]|nr:ATP-binding protein [Candidatus Bathyarchaeota archaeon]
MKEPFAQFVTDNFAPNILLITCGLPGTYKTETSQEIAKIKGYPILRTDIIRLEVLKNEDIFDVKIAGNMNKREMVYDEMFRQAHELAQKGNGVILDATFVSQKLRRRAAEVAAKTNIPFVILQTSCSKDSSMRRILRRTKENYESNALTEEAYIANEKRFEAPDLDDFKALYPNLEITHLIVDTEFDNPEKWFIISKVEK